MWILTLVFIMHLSYGDEHTIQNYTFNTQATCLIAKDKIEQIENKTRLEHNMQGVEVFGTCQLPLAVKEELK